MQKLRLLVIAAKDARYLKMLDAIAEDVDYQVTHDAGEAAAWAPEADLILTGVGASAVVTKAAVDAASKLRWLHSLSAGVDHLMATRLRQSDIPVTNAKGAYSPSLGEYAIASMLFFAKHVRRLLESQAAGKWDVFDMHMLQGKTLGILGYGDIGKESAKRAKAFGMKIIALRRRPEKSEGDGLADEIWGMERKIELMGVSDYVLLAMPQTPDTKGIVGETELRAMKPEGVIINLGRGNAIAETALLQALREKWIRGAALDVFEVEPLPDGHEFYKLPNLLLSAHTADHTSTWQEDSMAIFIENFALYKAGKPLRNIVDKTVGY